MTNFVNILDQAGNALVEVSRLYFAPNAVSAGEEPAFVEVALVLIDGSMATAILPTSKLNAAELQKVVPRFRVPRKDCEAFDAALMEEVHRFTELSSSHLLQAPEGKTPLIGYAFTTSGLQQLPSGQNVYGLGDQVLGSCDLPYIIRCDEPVTPKILPVDNPLQKLLAELTYADPQVSLAVAYLGTTLMRSWIMRETSSWQAVLAIVGGQGLGKTTLARRLTDWIQDTNGDPALLFSAGSTASAIRDTMVSARDLPIVIDDLCLSASSKLQSKYRDLGAQLVREGTNAAPIVKKLPGGKSTKQQCSAGIIMTAEFALDNASDITRCIFLNIDKPLCLPPSLSSDLIGAACVAFLEWFLVNETLMQNQIQHLSGENWASITHPRVKANVQILDWGFRAFAYAASTEGASQQLIDIAYDHFCEAMEHSLDYQDHLLDQLDRQRQKGNISALLLEGYNHNTFDLCKNVKKLKSHEGIIWHGDLCLRREALERFVRLQDGYGNYTIAKIVQELKDIGALVIQEDGTAQVKLAKGAPRVYRIRSEVLFDTKQEF